MALHSSLYNPQPYPSDQGGPSLFGPLSANPRAILTLLCPWVSLVVVLGSGKAYVHFLLRALIRWIVVVLARLTALPCNFTQSSE